ncbi:MAG: ABC transporter ATP-binding protein, partial [Nanoarchaeota archaeon]|nr:ABC transporter ATP-binding protein [Nanoarchaeota archaeon]
WGLLLMVIMTESLFVVDKFLFKRLIDDGEMFLSGTLGYEPFINVLIVIAIIFIFILISRSITKWITENIVIKFEGNLIKDLKKKYFDHIIGLSHEFHSTHKTGSLISRLGRGAHAIESLTDNLLYNFAPLVLQLILVSFSIALFSLNSAIVLFFVTVIFIGYSYYLQKLQAPFKLAHNSAEDSEKGFVSDIFMNIDSIKYFGKERRIKYKFEKTLNNTRSKLIKDYSYYRWMSSGQMFILGIGTLFLIYFPIKEFLAGQITLGTLVFIYTIYGNIEGNLFGFVFGIRNFYRAMADFQNLFEYGKIENEIKDKSNANDLKIEKGEIEFKNISFNYDKRKLFSNFNLKIKENEKIALVGHSGCGKSTLIKLLNRFYDVSKGVILIDGVNIKNIKQESLREETGIVPQEAILFDDTIYNNIKFANNKASRKQILKAMKFAQLDKIVKNFPKGLQTIVGERGVKLSGGEKQRVSIARAILANKKILVLDEATSALDSETEHEIQKDFQKLLRGRTSIIIAHRLSTIMNADRIIVLKEGKIVQQGKHKDLIKRKGEYVKLWDLQKGGYVLD